MPVDRDGSDFFNVTLKERPVAFDVLVEGTVQRVGFRRFAERLAKQFQISGYVQNKPDGTVNIFVRGDKDKVDGFISRINNAPEPIAVERLDKKESKPRPVIKRFQVKMGSIAAEINGLGAMESQFGDYREEFRGFTSEFRDYRGEFRDFSERTDDNFKGLYQIWRNLNKADADSRRAPDGEQGFNQFAEQERGRTAASR